MLAFHIITEPHLDAFLQRVPAAENLEVRQFFNGPESFTPDGYFLFGDSPEVSTEVSH